VSLAPTVQLEAGDPVPARRGRHLLWPAIALGHNRQLCFIAEPATTARVDHIQAADRLTIPDNVHGYNTVHIDVDIASALPNASIPQGGPARMRTPYAPHLAEDGQDEWIHLIPESRISLNAYVDKKSAIRGMIA
jgi:hypothetical protein